MMTYNSYSISQIAEVLHADASLANEKALISKLLIDTRIVVSPDDSLFFAINAKRDGHDFIEQAYQKGVRSFVISKPILTELYPDANFLRVADVTKALQQLATFHRESKKLQVVGITGSNGKTIVKEWLFQLLSADFQVVRSPKSFNSQIGVPLSVWQITDGDNLALFEAGISSEGEMQALADIIKPNTGILTNIGEAHAEGFASRESKLKQKLSLFKEVDCFIYSPDYVFNIDEKEIPGHRKFTWSCRQKADLQVTAIESVGAKSLLTAIYQGNEIQCQIPFSDRASIENAIICWSTLLSFGYTSGEAKLRLGKLSPVSMRLALLNGIDNCSIIDDSYSADISSLSIALDFLNTQNQHPKRTLILSDLQQTGKDDDRLYQEISQLLKEKKVDRLIGIGPKLSYMASYFELEKHFFLTTQAFLDHLVELKFNNETILIKGARNFGFEQITKVLTLKVHDTVLEINLNALSENLKFYRSKLNPGVKTMAMVKAFSYGSGSFEIANLLQYQKVDYLTVAFVDEGISLRKGGISLPIMVMSPEPIAFESMLKYKLEPEIYSLPILNSFLYFLSTHKKDHKIHLKIDTGMHRLGFERHEISDLLGVLLQNPQIKVQSIFTHLVASDDERHDEFTRHQIEEFTAIYNQIVAVIGQKPIKHCLNTSGISRWGQAQMDMVRIGIGLYGFDQAIANQKGLQTVATLKTTITQIKTLARMETVGYSRKGILPEGGKIATVKIGYADGYNRRFGNGTGKMIVNGHLVPTIGSICMDMCMLNVTGVDAKVGDEVTVFNDELTIENLANQIDTIPYEILTNISQRVKRIYFFE